MDKSAITDFFSHYGATYENAVYLCNKYFSLPNYEEMLALALEGKKGVDILDVYPR